MNADESLVKLVQYFNQDGSPITTDLQLSDLRANILAVTALHPLQPVSAIMSGTSQSEGNA
jgi:hypothetical protein